MHAHSIRAKVGRGEVGARSLRVYREANRSETPGAVSAPETRHASCLVFAVRTAALSVLNRRRKISGEIMLLVVMMLLLLRGDGTTPQE